MSVVFGASVAPDRQASDRARIGSYLARLARVTGHPISLDDSAPNFFVYIVSEDERGTIGPALMQALPQGLVRHQGGHQQHQPRRPRRQDARHIAETGINRAHLCPF